MRGVERKKTANLSLRADKGGIKVQGTNRGTEQEATRSLYGTGSVEKIHTRFPQAWMLTRKDDVMGKGNEGRERAEKCSSKKKKGRDFLAIEKRTSREGFSKIRLN